MSYDGALELGAKTPTTEDMRALNWGDGEWAHWTGVNPSLRTPRTVDGRDSSFATSLGWAMAGARALRRGFTGMTRE